jgi:hypothetical protein
MANLQSYESSDLFYDDLAKIKRGDIIGVKGYPTRTKTGELSIVPRKLELLSPCLHAMPHFYGLKDKVNSLNVFPHSRTAFPVHPRKSMETYRLSRCFHHRKPASGNATWTLLSIRTWERSFTFALRSSLTSADFSTTWDSSRSKRPWWTWLPEVLPLSPLSRTTTIWTCSCSWESLPNCISRWNPWLSKRHTATQSCIIMPHQNVPFSDACGWRHRSSLRNWTTVP